MSMTMTDHDALVRVSLDYADAVRRGVIAGAADWAATWTDDAVWNLPGRRVEGRAAIVELWRGSLSRYAHVVQIYNAASYSVDGDTASGRIQLLELTQATDGTRAILAGHYDDTYRRQPDGWRYTQRTLTVYYRGAPDLSGSFT